MSLTKPVRSALRPAERLWDGLFLVDKPLGVTSHDGALIFVLDVTRLRPLVDAASPLRGSMHPVVASRPPAPGPPPSGPSGGRT